MLKIFFFSILLLFLTIQSSAKDEITLEDYSINKGSVSPEQVGMDKTITKGSFKDVVFILILIVIVLVFVWIFVSQDKKSEKDKKALEERLLKEKFKNEMIKERINIIAHFLKNPLQAIVNSSYEIIDGVEDNIDRKTIEEKAESIVDEVQKSSQRIDEYLQLLKSEFNLSDTIKFSNFFMKKKFKKNNIELEYKEKINYTYYGDRNDLDMVLTILLENSVRALSHVDIKKKIVTIELIEEDTNYLIFVKDNGEGIDFKNRDRIFEKGFTTKDEEGGGFGLYFAKNIIVNDFKGEIKLVDDNETSFKITLPKELV